MSAGNDDNTIGGTVGEQVNDGGSPEAKEHQNKEIPGNGVDELFSPLTLPTTSTITAIRDPTKTKEELQTKDKPTSSHSNLDLTPSHGNKSGGTWSKVKRLISRKPQSHHNGGVSENVKNQAKENSATDSQAKPGRREKIPEQQRLDNEPNGKNNFATDPPAKPEQGEKTEQHRAINLSQNLAAQHGVPTDQPADLLSTTTKVGENAKQQQDQGQDDFHLVVETDHVETESPEPEKVPKHEMEIATLKEQLAKHKTAIESLQKSVDKNTSAIASLKDQDPGSSTTNDKVRKIKPVVREGEVTALPTQERPGEGLFFRKADGLSLTDVANLVGELNSQIDQTATLIMDLLRESPSPGSDSEVAGDGLHSDLQEYLGSWLCNKLQHRSEEHEMVAQIALQAGLVHACSRVINDWNPPFWDEGLAFSRVYNNITRVEGPITADTWRALARNHMGVQNDQLEANKKYLEDVLLKLIIAVSGSKQSGETLLQKCHEKVDDITKKAIDIHQAISQETRSTDLSTFTVESGADFDQSRMEDTEGSAGPSTSKVVCTLEMGLRSRKRVPSRQQSVDGLGKVGGVTLKAKVVLFATLGEAGEV